MKSRTLLNIIISLVVGFIIGGYLYSTISSANTAQEFSKRSYCSSYYGKTQDGILCDVSYSWYVNNTISENKHLEIDSLIRRTITESFLCYKHEQIIKIPSDFTVDFKSRIENAVHAIEPGFVMTNVFITIKSHSKQTRNNADDY